MSFINAIFVGGGLAIIVTIIEEWRMYKLKKRLDTAHSKLQTLDFQYPRISRYVKSIHKYKNRK
jgi:hypothetical protein